MEAPALLQINVKSAKSTRTVHAESKASLTKVQEAVGDAPRAQDDHQTQSVCEFGDDEAVADTHTVLEGKCRCD